MGDLALRQMVGVAAGLFAIISAMLTIALPFLLTKHRRDIKPQQDPFSGKSRFWQVNVLSWSNYTVAGRPLLVTLYISGAVLVGSVLVLAYF